MNNSTVILIAVIVIVLGIVLFAVMSARSKAEAAKREQIIALIQYKQSQNEAKEHKQTAWLDAIAGLGEGIGGIFGGPAGAAGANAGGDALKNLPFFS